MRRFFIFVILMIILFVGGGLTAMLLSNSVNSVIPTLTTTQDPDASVMIVQGWKAEVMFVFVGIVLASLIGIAVVVGLIMWLTDRSMQNTALREAGVVPSAGTTVEVRNAELLNAGSDKTS